MERKIISFIRDLYETRDFIPLHAPCFGGKEREYVLEAIDSTFVSSVGRFVDEFEERIKKYTGCSKAVATVNGTSALQASLHLVGVKNGDLVITQPLTFVATCNAISLLGAEPIFVDVSRATLGMCPQALQAFLDEKAYLDDMKTCRIKLDGRRVKAVVPMHTFGHPVELDELKKICMAWNLELVEDAAESLGSFYKGQHTGTFGRFGVLSFNGNKIITTGGGGMILCAAETDGFRAKHITTTAKIAHPYEYVHDEVAFNFRLPNLNSALGCAQMDVLERFLESKRNLASLYEDFFKNSSYKFVTEPPNASSNYWLNAILCESIDARDEILRVTNKSGIMTRPVWRLMHRLPMYENCSRGSLDVAEELECILVNLPSSPRSLIATIFSD